MAQADFEVKGRTYFYMSSTTGSTSFSGMTQIGMTNAEDLPAPEERVHVRVEHTNESGPELPALLLHHGRSLLIRVPLIKWNEAGLEPLTRPVGATAEGEMGTLGGRVPLISVGITGSIAGSKAYIYPYCRFVDSIIVDGWGLQAARKIVTVEAFPNMDALSTASTKYYTAVTVS